jgi:hypothetical protein
MNHHRLRWRAELGRHLGERVVDQREEVLVGGQDGAVGQ